MSKFLSELKREIPKFIKKYNSIQSDAELKVNKVYYNPEYEQQDHNQDMCTSWICKQILNTKYDSETFLTEIKEDLMKKGYSKDSVEGDTTSNYELEIINCSPALFYFIAEEIGSITKPTLSISKVEIF